MVPAPEGPFPLREKSNAELRTVIRNPQLFVLSAALFLVGWEQPEEKGIGRVAARPQSSAEQPESDSHSGIEEQPVALEAPAGESVISTADPRTYGGHVRFGHEVRSFSPCGGDVSYWLVDRTDGELREIYESLAFATYQPVFVILEGSMDAAPTEGFGADYDGQLVVNRVRRAEAEGHGCDEDLEGLEFRARGNEPFWTLDVGTDSIRFSELGVPERVSWPVRSLSVESGIWVYSAFATEESIRVTLREQPCRDSMSGAYFSFVAQVDLGSLRLSGCAARGL
jgi:uncharacterized membrane protein